MKLLVTGGAGFIGSAVIRKAVEQGHFVINVDALTYASSLENLSAIAHSERYVFEHVDVRNRAELDRIFAQYRPNAVMHLAAESHVDRSIGGAENFLSTNISGTFNLLEAALQYWTGEGQPADFRFHHVSTDEVYGSLGPEGAFSETSPYCPRNPYSATKAASDHLALTWFHTYDLPVLLTNCSNNYGPFQFPEKLIPVVILNSISGKSIPIYGDGRNVRDWLFVEDHATALLQVLQRGKLGRSYNIGGENELSNIDLVRKICAILDLVLPKRSGSYEDQIVFVNDRPGHDARYAIDSSRIRSELGWRPSMTIDDGLEFTVQWYLENRNWWERLREKAVVNNRFGSKALAV